VDAGWRLIQRHRMEDAARLFKEAAAKDPENAVAHRAYQTVMQCMGRHEALKDEYRDYLKAHPASGVAFYSTSPCWTMTQRRSPPWKRP